MRLPRTKNVFHYPDLVHLNCHTVRHVRDVIQRLVMRLILKRVIVQALLPPRPLRICVILIVKEEGSGRVGERGGSCVRGDVWGREWSGVV